MIVITSSKLLYINRKRILDVVVPEELTAEIRCKLAIILINLNARHLCTDLLEQFIEVFRIFRINQIFQFSPRKIFLLLSKLKGKCDYLGYSRQPFWGRCPFPKGIQYITDFSQAVLFVILSSFFLFLFFPLFL